MDNKQETKKPTLSVWAQVVAFVSSYFGKKEDSLSDQDFVKLLESTNQLTQTKLSEKETSS